MYTLPDHLRPALAEPLGPVLPDEEGVARAAAAAERGTVVVAVGDVTTARLLAGGVVPRVMVVDGRTKRGEPTPGLATWLRSLSATPVVRVSNPPARITEELWRTLATALASATGGAKGATIIEVDGEEDLAALPAALLAPDGALVCYGQPDRGMVVATVDDALRNRVRKFLSQMES
ncbi:MAG TPA: DUF359 domain-containing protein [Candidatus Thermoplasmatota archaeon]|nr:DUF359 domain-containing protein [Candidatus Thermoplasmatota archaeon]